MKRSEKEITDRSEIDRIIHTCEVCHLAFAVNSEPYVLPVSYGYDGSCLYIHTAKEGRKIDMLAVNPRVCFQMERDVRLYTNTSGACQWSFHYESVIGFGVIGELTKPDDKSYGLSQVVRHYGGSDSEFEPHKLNSTRVWRISIDTVTGKRSG